MFQQNIQNYNLMDASMDIFTIFIGAFVLGMVLGWLLKPSCKQKDISNNLIEIDTAWNIEEQKTSKNIEEDFTIIEWIGPKIDTLLKKSWFITLADISKADVLELEEILIEWGSRFASHNPATWPDQARLAHEGKWSELEEYQEILNGWKKKQKK